MNCKKTFALCMAIGLILGNYQAFAQTAEELLPKGIHLEEVKGELEKAIEVYQTIVDKFSDNRPIAAKAYLHIGICYEKLGNQQAKKAYQQVIQKYAEQTELVLEARGRLADLEKPESSTEQKGMTIRQVWVGPDVNSDGEPSPNGKYLSFTEYKTSGDLAIREIVTGTKRRLTSEADWSDLEFAHSSRWSPDGKKLAYAWSIGNGNELRITGLDGSEPRILYKNKELNCNPQDWTPDGKNILATFVRNDKNCQIGLISVADGSIRILKTLDQPHFPLASVSPGGHTIVYDFPSKEGSSERDIFLISIDGKREIPLVNHSADDRFLGWTPDGKNILFVSDRTGTHDMWRIRVTDGNPQGDPELIKKDIGQIWPMGFTQQGSFYYSSKTNMMDVFTAKLDLEKGAILSPPKEITQRFIGSNLTPDWSSDGQYLAYISLRNTEQSGPNTCILCIRSEQTGEVRELYPQIKASWNLRWSPDGRSIFIAAEPKKGRQGLFRIDLQNGDITPVAQSEPGSIIKDFAFSFNGNSVFYVYYQWKKKIVSILRHDLATGKEKEVYRKDTPPDIGGVLVSPDGQYLSFGTFESENNHVIKIIPIAGGEPRDLFRMKSNYPGQSGQYAWTPNGKEIFFVKQVSSMNKKAWELWQVPVQGGEFQKIGLSKKRILLPRFHPDGKRITFMTFKSIEEIWVMENFLPLEKLAHYKEPEGIRIKQIWKKPYLDFLGTVSFDGRFFSYVDWGKGDLAIHNLMNGKNRLLTHEAILDDQQHFAQSSAISKNGKQIAYSWWNMNHTSDLRLVDADNPSPRLLYRKEGEEVYPVTWLSDEELIVTRYNYETKIAQICSFSILDGTIHVLKTFERRNWPQISSSPDEKYIAYDVADEIHGGNFDINLLAVDGGSEISLVKHPANDRVLDWVPGRKEFLFISDRSGTWDLWAIPVDNGKPSGPVKRIYTDIGEVQPMGFTRNGECFFGFSRRNFNAYIAPFNVETGELKEKSGKSLLGSNLWIKWSPDGQYLTYIKENTKADSPWQLTIQDLKTGEERKLADNLLKARSPCWSPDGNSILVVGTDKNKYRTKGYKGGIYIVDVKTGQTTEILLLSNYKYNTPGDDAFPLSDIEWSSDGKSIFYLFFKDRLVKHDLETGEEKILYKHSHFDRGLLNRSPDGKSLLFAVVSPEEKKSHLFTMPVEGGKEKELCTSQEADGFDWGFWSPDGKYIYFSERSDGTNLWRIPADGGMPQKVWHSKNRTEVFSIHPDGKLLALAIRERTTEIRVIENLVQELEKIDNLSK